MTVYIIAAVLCLLAAFFNAVMDTLKDHYMVSIFSTWKNRQFWDASISWANMYINHDKAQGRTFWKVLGMKVIKPAIITDGWHLSKFFMQLSLGCAFGVLTPYFLGLPAFFVVWFIGFEGTCSQTFRK